MIRSNCSVMLHPGYEALENANLSTRGYKLSTDSGLMRYTSAADRVLTRDAAFMISIRNAPRSTSCDVLEQITYGLIGVYVYLDHDIDLNTGLPVR
ncbi:MAG: hypothetical protein ACTS2F_08070 [Thainema sp.]